jgi:hypothetical protein
MKKAQPKAYSLEFREEALRQLAAGTKPIRQLAQELGVHIETLRNWRRDARALPVPNPTPSRQSLARRIPRLAAAASVPCAQIRRWLWDLESQRAASRGPRRTSLRDRRSSRPRPRPSTRR